MRRGAIEKGRGEDNMRNHAKRKVPIAIKLLLAVLAVAVLLGGGLFAKMQYEQSIMTPLATGEVIPGIYAVNNGFVNCYLAGQGDEYLMIDAGNDIRQTKAALEQLDISPDAVKAVFLTHSDSDHAAALSLFPDAQVYLPALETQMIDGTTKRSPMGYNQLDREYIPLEDGAVITSAGFHVRCISTPGHTPGSMSFFVDGRYLFVGDTMSLHNGKADLFNGFYNMDSAAQEESIRNLATTTQPEYIFTGHYGHTDDVDAAYEAWR